MTWIRVDAGISSDPAVLALRGALGCSMAAVLGHLTAVWLRVSEHSPEVGKIRGVPDAALEGWALWEGEPGCFARPYRELFQDKKGCVNQWVKYNGRYFRERREEADRKRNKRRAAGSETSDHLPADVRRTSGRRPPAVRRISSSSSSSTNIPPKSPTDADGAAGPSGARAAAVGDSVASPDAMRTEMARLAAQIGNGPRPAPPPDAELEPPPVSPEKAAEIETKRKRYKQFATPQPEAPRG